MGKKVKHPRQKEVDGILSELLHKKENAIEEKILLLKDFCAHLKKGNHETSFEHCDINIIRDIVTELDRKYNTNYFRDMLGRAVRANFGQWEETCIKALKNESRDFNASLWIYNMRMRFGELTRFDNTQEEQKTQVIKVRLTLDNTSNAVIPGEITDGTK